MFYWLYCTSLRLEASSKEHQKLTEVKDPSHVSSEFDWLTPILRRKQRPFCLQKPFPISSINDPALQTRFLWLCAWVLHYILSLPTDARVLRQESWKGEGSKTERQLLADHNIQTSGQHKVCHKDEADLGCMFCLHSGVATCTCRYLNSERVTQQMTVYVIPQTSQFTRR